MNDLISVGLSWIGIVILFYRLIPRYSKKETRVNNQTWPKVTIVVPSRDEEHNLPKLLTSLKNLDYPSYEVIVIDDNSKDRTKKIAEEFCGLVISGTPPPSGWNGKNWACHQALGRASGDLYLFTDADTEHHPNSLKRAVSHFLSSGADMISALPYHRVERWWEKLMGPFHAILLAATAPYSPKPKRLFAIGQYLMFSKESYHAQGGHAAVKSEYPDDLALANACLRNKGKFQIYMGKPLFNVRMYGNFIEFVSGWRRNFLAGIQQSNWWAPIEVTLIFCGITGGGKIGFDMMASIPAFIGLFVLALFQKKWGKFSYWGIVFFPLSLLLFCWVTVLAAYDYATGNVLRWKGREYTGWVTKNG